jgi:hypothetical protein
MGHTEAADLLQETLDEEKAADQKLSSLAEGGINQTAAEAAHPEREEEMAGVGARSTKRSSSSGSSKGRSSRR